MKFIILFLSALFIAVISYGVGYFSSSFEANSCYSEVISLLSKTTRDDDSELHQVNINKKLPLRGYETDCQEVLQTLKQID